MPFDTNLRHPKCIWGLYPEQLDSLARQTREMSDDPDGPIMVVTENDEGDGVVILDAADGLDNVDYPHHGYVAIDPITGKPGFSGTPIPVEDEPFLATIDPDTLEAIAKRCRALSSDGMGPVDFEAAIKIRDWKLEADLGWLVDEIDGAYCFFHVAGYTPDDRTEEST